MIIRILGTRAKIEAKQKGHSLHSGIMIDRKLLLDIGEKKFLSRDVKYLLITHMHPDHAFFQYDGEKFEIRRPLEIYAPEKHKKVGRIKVFEPFKNTRVNGYKIIPVPVIHSIKVKSLGYIIESGGKRIFYTGDVAWIEKKDRERMGKVDLVITEGSYIRKGGLIRRDQKSGQIFGHTGIPDLVKMFCPFTSRIIIVHLGTWFMKDVQSGQKKIRALGGKKLRVEAGYDGKVIKI